MKPSHACSLWPAVALATAAMLALTGCGASSALDDASSEIPTELTEDVTVSFWHVYQGSDAAALDALIQQFEEQNPQVTVDAQFTGGFAEQTKKIVSSLQAGDPPNLAIAYPSDVINYESSGRVMNLTPYIEDATVGLSPEELEDVFDIQRTINRYDAADGDYLSFPFTANVMVLFYNVDLLESVGIDSPPTTWDEFRDQCGIILEELDLPCFSARGDGSTFNGIVGAFGGTVRDENGAPALDTEPWTQALTEFENLAAAGYSEVAGGAPGQVTGPDLQSFISQRSPFILGSSRNIGFLPDAVGDTFDWAAAAPPQPEATDEPTSVLYGPGLAAFTTGADEDLATWQLMKFLTSAESQSFWAAETGQLPIRASVADSESFLAKLAESPSSAVAYSLLPGAVWDGTLGENGVITVISQKERETLASVMNAVLIGDMTAEQGQDQLVAGIAQ
jgi:ABC-type glycerol-3-phosphate transport system substrate-binding protein